MLRRLIAVAVALAAVALPASAQRGGGGHAASVGHSGGLISSGTRSSFSSPSHSSFAPVAQFGGSQFRGSQFGSNRFTSSPRLSAVNPFHRRDDHDADDRFRYDRFRRPYNSVYTVGLPYSVGWLDPGYLSYSASAFYDSPASAPPQAEPDDYQQPQYNPPPVEQAEAPAPSYRPAYQRPQTDAQLPPAEGVTLVFKDGRPTEQIHNFLLTRITLYLQDDHLRPIPVDQLDLAATTKLNADAGVVFKLPSPTR